MMSTEMNRVCEVAWETINFFFFFLFPKGGGSWVAIQKRCVHAHETVRETVRNEIGNELRVPALGALFTTRAGSAAPVLS